MSQHKYIAIKLDGAEHFVWFEKCKTVEGLGVFDGKDGWGKGGAHTNVKARSSQIVARIESESLQYT